MHTRDTSTGKVYENKTSLQDRLIKKNFIEITNNNSTYYKKETEYVDYYLFSQQNCRIYFKTNFNIILPRKPDEAILIHHKTKNKYILRIIEKKFQKCDGSVDEKLYAGYGIKQEYILTLNNENFTVDYCFSLNDWFKKDKYILKRKIINSQNIQIFFGEDVDYFDKILNYCLDISNF